MTEPRVVLDACVLFPQYLKDFLLMQAWKGRLFDPFWSKEINNEWIRNLLVKKPALKEENLRQTERDMNLAFPQAETDGSEHLKKIDSSAFKDKNDLHVVATAIAANADFIFTMNIKDFPNSALEVFGIRAISPDAFFSELSTHEEVERMARVFAMQVAKYRFPPRDFAHIISVLEKSGMRKTCEQLKKIF